MHQKYILDYFMQEVWLWTNYVRFTENENIVCLQAWMFVFLHMYRWEYVK